MSENRVGLSLQSVEAIADPVALKLIRDLTVEVLEGNEVANRLEKKVAQLEQKVMTLVQENTCAVVPPTRLIVHGDNITEIPFGINKALTEAVVSSNY